MSVRLELASSPGFPRGSASRAFLLRLPINDDSSIDGNAIRHNPGQATVRRFWASEADMLGNVVKKEGDWMLRCSRRGESLNYLMRDDRMTVNQVLSIKGEDEIVMPFRVVSMDPIGSRLATS